MTCNLTPGQKLKRCFWKYRVLIGFLCLAAGIVVAMMLIEKETSQRQRDNREARLQLQHEVEERIEKGEAHQRALDDQLARLEKVNSVQNDIIRTLLGLRRNDPELFDGVQVPTPEEFAEQVGGEPVGSDQPIDDPVGGSVDQPCCGNEGRPNPGTGGRPDPGQGNGGGNGGGNGSGGGGGSGTVDPGPVHPDPGHPPVSIIVEPLPPIILPAEEPDEGGVVDPIAEIVCNPIGVCFPNTGL